MIVKSLMLFALGAVVLAGVEARAQDCAPAAIMDTFRKAEAAYARKDFAAAAAGFRPLAEQGLGPAQLRLGQILAGDAAKPDLVEAYRWTVLATDTGVAGAKEAFDALKPRLSAQQIAQAAIDPARWQPAQLWPCLAVDPRVKRPDGSTGYDVTLLINHVLAAKSATAAPARREQWLARSLEAIRTKSPRYLIYFRALYGIGFVAGAGSFVVVEQRDNLPLVVVNESDIEAVALEQLQELVSATLFAVNVALLPPVITPAVETYKGFTIRTTTTEGGQRFLTFMKSAIDMIVQLPPDLAALARATPDLRYEPRRPYDPRGGALTTSTFLRDAKTGQGYLSFSENFSMRGPGHMVISLVDGGVFLRRTKPRVADAKHGDCEIEDYEIKTMEALKFDAREIDRKYKARIAVGCG